MKSIRANLVLWVSGALAAGMLTVLAVSYALAHAELSKVFDEELRQIAQAVHLREDWREAGTLRLARPGFVFQVRAYDGGGRVYYETVSPRQPFDVPRTFESGFSDIETPNGAWRVYTHVAPEGVVQAAQPQATRAALARELSVRMVLPQLALIPLLALLMTWVLDRGLAPLAATSRRVRERDAARLDPLPTAGVPRELAPLVEQINALLGRLADSFAAQRRFIADAAHELRSPVAALALQAQLAQRAQPGAERATAFAELARGIERTRRLVQQLLDLARLEPGERAEAPAPLDLARLVREVVAGYAAQAEALGVDLGVEAPPAVHATGAASELRSLVANLVDNALRYAPRGSEITASLRQDGAAIELAVTDCGPGIAPGERARVFERFQRAAGDTKRGSGLGLPIARAIAERHGGSIVLEDAHPGREPPGLAVRVRMSAS